MIRLYEPEDAFKFRPHKYFEHGIDRIFDQQARATNGIFFSFLNDSGNPIGCVGISPVNNGCAEVTALLSEEILARPKTLHSFVSMKLEELRKALSLRRVQATVRTDFVAGKRWIHRLGFEQEGVLRKFGIEGHDYGIWSLI